METDLVQVKRRQIRNYLCTRNLTSRAAPWVLEHLTSPRFVVTVTEPNPGDYLVATVDCPFDRPLSLEVQDEVVEVFGEFLASGGQVIG